MAPLMAEDRCLIKCLRLEIWNAFQMMREFPSRKWKKTTLNYLIRKLDKTVQLTELHPAVVLALSKHTKTFRRSKSSFVARKVNRERAKVPEKLLERLECRTVLFGPLLRRI